MKRKDIFNIGLPKWPALVVIGESITKEQAMEVLIRTGGISYLSCNDHEFEKQVNGLLYGLELVHYDLHDGLKGKYGITEREVYRKIDEIISVYKPIDDINYLNNYQIMSNYIGGPHGWCNWEGKIFTNSYNIGKWPSIKDIYDEWKIIAKTFPFLNLKCQLFSGEQCEENTHPIVQFDILNGKIKMFIPDKELIHPIDCEFNIFDDNAEKGCTIKQLKKALNYVKNL